MGTAYGKPPITEHKNFIRETGITDPQSKQDLYDFMSYLKNLGILNDICCLPLRSSQNDTSSYKSFGGFGVFSPSKVGTVTDGADGITVGSGSSNYFKLANSFTLPTHPNIMYITQTDYEVWDGIESAGAYTNRCYYWTDDTGGAASSFWMNNNWYRQARFYGGIPTNGTSGGFYTTQSGYHSDQTWRSVGIQRLSTYTDFKPRYYINGSDATGPYGGSSSYSVVDPPNTVSNPRVVQAGTYAMIMMADNFDLTQLLGIYKQTLGKGLGLP